jgi:hypothetical protein
MGAGLGFKDFTTGEVLTANDVDGYLMQGVWVFASAAARSAAVTSPQEGNFSFLKDTNSTEYYDGAAWVAVGGSSGALTKINTTSFSAVASQAVNSVFTSTYKNYRVLITLSGCTADGIVYLRMRASGTDSAINYFYGVPAINAAATGANETGSGQAQFPLSDLDSVSNASRYAYALDIYNPQAAADTSFGKVFNAIQQASTVYGGAGGGLHNVATAYDGFSIIASAGNITGKVTTYGYSD